MKLDRDYLESIIHKKHFIYDRELHPFCLNDVIFLEAIQSPLLDKSQNSTQRDLALAVLICSTEASLVQNEINAFLNGKKSIRKALKLIIKAETEPFVQAAASFKNYIEDYFSPPDLWNEKEDGKSITAPWVLVHAAIVMKGTGGGICKEEVFRMPLGELFWWSATISELGASGVSFKTEADRIAIETARRLQEEDLTQEASNGKN